MYLRKIILSKFSLLLPIAILLTAKLFAQGPANLYSFAESLGTYTAITGTSSTAAGDDGTQNNIAIGFTFNFGGTNYTTFSVTTNGFIKLGGSITTGGANFTNAIGAATNAPLIAPFWDDNNLTGGNIQYATTGTAGSQVLTVQWTNVHIGNGGSTTTPTSSFQIQLFEGTNVIQFVYGTTSAALTNATVSVGITSASGNYLSVTPGTPATYSTTTANNSISAYIPANTVYTFIPPVPCSGTPNPGNTLATANPVCSGASFTLSLQNNTSGTGVTYQWESSPIGANTWSAISGATNATYTATMSSELDYHCIVTCSNGGASGTSNTISVTYSLPLYCYCNPASNCTNEGIENVTFGTLNNTSTSCNNTSGYTDYSNLGSMASVTQAQQVPVSVTAHINSNPATAGVWIDYDHSGTFDASEYTSLGNATVTIPSGGTSYAFTGNINIDANAMTGVTRMRVRSANQSGITSGSACVSSGVFGEFEDYLITIDPGTPCGAAPAGGTATSSLSSVSCSGTPFTLSATGYATGVTGLSFQWQESSDGISYTNLGSATSNYSNYTVSSISQTMYYKLEVTCNNGGAVGYSNDVTISFATPVLPWTENFDALTTLGTTSFPPCGYKENGDWASSNATAHNTAHSGANYIRDSWTATNEYIWTPGFDLTAGTSYDLSFYVQGDGFTGWNVDIYQNASQSSTGATAIGNFTATGSGTIAIQAYEKKTFTFVPAASGIYYFGIRVNQASGTPWYIAFDDFKLELTPACSAPTTFATTNLGSTTADIGWNTIAGAVGYEYVLDQTSADPAGSGTATTDTFYNATGLNGATTYYLHTRTNCGSGNYSSWNSTSFTTQIVNDNAPGAILLTLGAGCTGNPYTSVSATQSPGEPYPSCSNNSTGHHTVWFKFVAPASGAVRISTDVLPAGTLADTKIGLFSATDVNDYSTFTIIACDEDGGVNVNFNSIMFATNLTGGNTYYVQVDGFGTTDYGTFCVIVDELNSSMIASAATTCATSFQTPFGANPAYTGWQAILTNSNGGQLVAMVQNPAGGAVSNYTGGVTVNTSGVRQSGTDYYLDRNYRINNATATNVNLRLFFLDAELSALSTAAGGVTLGGLNVTHQSGSTCQATYNSANGTNTVLMQNGNGSVNGVDWIEVTTPSFSNFYIMQNIFPLSVELENIAAVNAGTRNRIDWNTATESNGDHFVVERSLDARNFTAIGDVAANGKSSNYTYWDQAPATGINYYRLKMTDAAGKYQYSKVVSATVNANGAFTVEAFPNPVTDVLTVSIHGVQGANASISVCDVTGKVLITTSVDNNTASINMSNLPQGIYLIKYANASNAQTIKVNKQ